jgi:RNA polymerase sigma-70 factor (ECF subfamily)
LKVFESFDRLREPERVRSWVFRIAKNACLMKRRKSVFAPSHELSLEHAFPAHDEEGSTVARQLAETGASPDALLLRDERHRMVRAAIGELPEIYRSVILLRDFEELSTEETAEVLEVGTDVVKTRLHRARMALRRTLADYMAVPVGG